MGTEGKQQQMAERPIRGPRLVNLIAEPRVVLEVAALVPALPMLMRAPRGDGHDVIVIPPFGIGDALTKVLRLYLGRLGYRVHRWGHREILGLHRLNSVAVRRLDEIADAAGGTVSLVGHSLGGIYAREVARAAPSRVRRVITVASPFAGDLKSNIVWPLYELATGTHIDGIPADLRARMNEPLSVPSTAIYSRTDGIVAWQTCTDVDAPGAENIEIVSSHAGQLHHPAALWVIADRLAQPEDAPQPYDPSGWQRLVARVGPPRDGR
jgi:pimeloyl-ACP methyl ester carboxylesterase